MDPNSPADLAREAQGEYSAAEVAHLVNIRELLDTVPELHKRRERAYRVRSKAASELGVDDAATTPTDLSHMVTYCQNVAIDNLRSLRLLLYPSEEAGIFLPQFGAYPLIRAVIESSAQAVWLLHPDESDERIARTLRARRSEVKYELDLSMMINREDSAVPSEVKKMAARGRQSAARRAKGWNSDIRSLAERAGLDPERVADLMPAYGPLIEDAAPAAGVPPSFARSTWQMVCGLTHPSSMRGLGFSRVQELPGTTETLKVTRMTADPGTVEAGLLVAITFCRTAEDLLAQRTLRPAQRRSSNE